MIQLRNYECIKTSKQKHTHEWHVDVQKRNVMWIIVNGIDAVKIVIVIHCDSHCDSSIG